MLIVQLSKKIKLAASVSITADGWLAPDGNNFEAVTFHLLDSDWNQISGLAAMYHTDGASMSACQPVSVCISACRVLGPASSDLFCFNASLSLCVSSYFLRPVQTARQRSTCWSY